MPNIMRDRDKSPLTVVINAKEIPLANTLGSPIPLDAILLKDNKTPRTVPSRPRRGEIVAMILTVLSPFSIEFI